jgi:hypothetical protein
MVCENGAAALSAAVAGANALKQIESRRYGVENQQFDLVRE